MHKNPSSSVNPAEIHFSSVGQKCAASFYRPCGAGPFPVIIMAHGLGGVRKMRLPAYAERFVALGYACLIFDYRHFGDSDGEPRQLLDVGRQLEDWKAAVIYARSIDGVDPSKVILWGTSFSGGHVLSIAADDPTLAAVITQVLFTDAFASLMAIKPIISAKISALTLADRLGSLLGTKPLTIPVVGHPGDTALLTAPGAYEGFFRIVPSGEIVKNYALARIGLDILRYNPGRKTPKIKMPVLFCICNNDSVVPTEKTLQHAKRTPHKEIKCYECDHFDIYVGEAFEKVIADQIDFLQRIVPVDLF